MSDPAPGTPNSGKPLPPQAAKPAPSPLPPLKLGQSLAPKPRPKIQAAVQADNIAVVTILESRILDESNINEIGRQLMELVTKQYMIKMVIDLSQVKYLSSAVLRQFIALYKAIKNEKGDLKLFGVNPEVREVFKITQLDKMIEIKDNLDACINSFKTKKGGWGFLQR
jgi:anti-anti-sigma factor